MPSTEQNISQLRNILNNTQNVVLSNVSAQQSYLLRVHTTLNTVTFFVMITAMLSNATVLLAVVCNRSRRTPFFVYIINVVGGNLLRLIAHVPPTGLQVFRARTVFALPVGDLCSLLLYTEAVLRIGSITMHAVIASNRMWALLHPLSYRRVHSTRFAVISCVLMWTGVNLLHGVFPLVERQELSRQNGNVTLCAQLANISRSTFLLNTIGVVLPVSVTLVAFPVVIWKMWQRTRRSSPSSVQPVKSSSSQTTKETLAPVMPSANEATNPAEIAVPTGRVSAGHLPAKDNVMDRLERQKKSTLEKQMFLLMLTISVAVCYGPSVVAWIMQFFTTNIWTTPLPSIAGLFFQSQAVLDAVLFVLMFEDLRVTLGRCCSCKVSKAC